MSENPNEAVLPESRRLLVVDDEEIVLLALRETLTRTGYEVVATGDATEAVELLRKERFSVIITDQQMPRMTGLEFLAVAKELQPDATRILITAVLNLGTVIEAINKGEIYRFIIKPWLREEFLGAVESAVQRYVLVAGNSQLRATSQAMNDRLTALNRELQAQVARVAEQNQQLESLNRALEQNLDRSVELCVRTIETFYPILASQARRVFELCRAMASVAQLPASEQRALGFAAWLHDIGLVGVPRSLIRRWDEAPGSLNTSERSLIEQHPILGADLVKFVDQLEAVCPAIRAHHERFDGRGFPNRLSGSAIPWLGRLLAVAVAYAESHESHATTVKAIQDQAGTTFDPEAVRIFVLALSSAKIPRRQREVSLAELRPGMVLAQGIYTPAGVLLVPGDHELSESHIDQVRHHHQLAPFSESLLVYC